MTGRSADYQRWSVSYRPSWWKRRYYACGYVPWSEAASCYYSLVARGFRSVRLHIR